MKRLLIAAIILFLCTSASHAQAIPPYHVNPEESPGGHINLTWEAGPADGLAEDFEDGIAQDFRFWTPLSESFPDEAYYVINQGRCEIVADQGGAYSSCVYESLEFSSLTCELEVVWNGEGTSWGLLYRTNGVRNDDFYGYEFLIGENFQGNRMYCVYSVSGNGNGFFQIPWTETDLINGIGESNILKVVAQGNTFDFYINGTYVDTDDSDLFASGFVGMILTQDTEASSDYITCSHDAQLQDRSVIPQRGTPVAAWLDVNGQPMDHPPLLADQFERDARRAENVTVARSDQSDPDHPRQQSLRGHQVNELDEFIEYRIYRNGDFIGATTDTLFTDQLPEYGDYEYRVTAHYDPEGESIPSVPATVNWQPVTFSLAGGATVVPHTGGTITYDALLFNELPQTFRNVSYRVYATLPNGSEVGPVFQRRFTLAAGAFHAIPGMTQTIPAAAPPGNYFLHGRLYHQGQLFYEETFQFDKMGGGE